jgi:dephospho-CoA kinase
MIDEFVSRATAPVAIEVSVPHAAPSLGHKLVVDLSNEGRTRRLRARGMTASQIDLRISRQLPREGYLQLADLVVNNDGDERRLRVSVGRVWRRWQAQPQARSGPADNHTR